jgi:hypothetical protein
VYPSGSSSYFIYRSSVRSNALLASYCPASYCSLVVWSTLSSVRRCGSCVFGRKTLSELASLAPPTPPSSTARRALCPPHAIAQSPASRQPATALSAHSGPFRPTSGQHCRPARSWPYPLPPTFNTQPSPSVPSVLPPRPAFTSSHCQSFHAELAVVVAAARVTRRARGSITV